MRENLRLTFQKGDMLCIALVALLAVALSAWMAVGSAAAGKATVQIYQGGTLVRQCSLEKEQTFTVTGDYTNTVSIRDGRVSITDSDCPGSDCVHSGWVKDAGRTIVCLPNRLEIRLTGGAAEVDMVAG